MKAWRVTSCLVPFTRARRAFLVTSSAPSSLSEPFQLPLRSEKGIAKSQKKPSKPLTERKDLTMSSCFLLFGAGPANLGAPLCRLHEPLSL